MAIRSAPDTRRIHSDPAIMVSKPVIRGTRIPVTLILESLAYTFDLEELFAAYPDLSIEDVKAALAYASTVVDADYRRSRHQREQSAAKA